MDKPENTDEIEKVLTFFESMTASDWLKVPFDMKLRIWVTMAEFERLSRGLAVNDRRKVISDLKIAMFDISDLLEQLDEQNKK